MINRTIKYGEDAQPDAFCQSAFRTTKQMLDESAFFGRRLGAQRLLLKTPMHFCRSLMVEVVIRVSTPFIDKAEEKRVAELTYKRAP